MSKGKALSYIEDLIYKIKYLDDLYYNKNYQEISDEEYDKLRKELAKLEKKFPSLKSNNSPNETVGAKLDNNLKTHNHNSAMLSLNNAYTKKEVLMFG